MRKKVPKAEYVAYEKGYKAFEQRLLPTHNPYKKLKEFKSYLDGWTAAFMDSCDEWR